MAKRTTSTRSRTHIARGVAGQEVRLPVGPRRTIARSSTACFECCKPGAQWDELPERYGKWKSVHKRSRAGQRRASGIGFLLNSPAILQRVPDAQHHSLEPTSMLPPTTVAPTGG